MYIPTFADNTASLIVHVNYHTATRNLVNDQKLIYVTLTLRKET